MRPSSSAGTIRTVIGPGIGLWRGLICCEMTGGVALICFGVERDAEEGELAADLLAHRDGVFADASGEDERVEAVEDGGVAGDGLGDGPAEDGDGLGSEGLIWLWRSPDLLWRSPDLHFDLPQRFDLPRR